MKTLGFLLVVITLSSSFHAQTLQDAIRKTQNERFSFADSDFRKLIQKEPTNGLNYFYYGKNFFEWGEVDSALMVWKKGAQIDPVGIIPTLGLGRSLWISGDKEGAKALFNKVLNQTKNKNAEVFRLIGETYLMSDPKNLDEAITMLETSIKLDPKNEDSYLLIGDALYEKTPTNASAAIKNYNEVLKLNPTSVRGLVRIGVIYKRAQNPEEADAKFKQAQQIDSTFAPAYRENAEMYMKYEKPKKAIECWRKYLALNNSLEARYRFSTALYNGKQYCELIKEVEGLQSNSFNNFYMERMLFYACLECTTETDAFKKGIAASDRFFKMVPQDKIIYLDYKNRGLLLLKSGQDSLAIIELEKASELNKKVAIELAGDLGKLYMKQKKYDKLINVYELKMREDKLSVSEYYDLGKAYYFGTKNYALADSSFAKVNLLSPSWAPGYWWRARTQLQLDPNKLNWSSQPFYEKVMEIVKVEERNTTSNKNMVMESCRYLGDYYVTSASKDLNKAKIYWKIVSEIDPNDAQAKAFLKANP